MTTLADSNFLDHVPTPNVLQLNDQMCGPLNRTGLLCSRCQPGLGPAVFSYRRECLKCMDQPYGWILFLVRVTFPLALFCVIVIILHINIASPALNGFVLAAQIISTTFNHGPFAIDSWLTTLLVTCFGFWNLDFFTYIIRSFCINERMSILTVIALEYTAALYPIILTIVVYYIITLHDKGCKILFYCWKPFHRCFTKLRRTGELKGSVINAFATFLLLSYSKFCMISVNLTRHTLVLDICGNSTYRVYYEASYETLSAYHTPYVVLASMIFIVFVCLPALFILLYQNRLFQKCLSFCKFKCTLIHELANITQGCFKNGTAPNTRDHRWFAGLYLLLRLLSVFVVYKTYYQLLILTVCCIMLFLVATIRPYRVDHYNTLDSFYWLIASIGSFWYVYSVSFKTVLRVLPFLLMILPLISGYVIWKILKIIIGLCPLQTAKLRKLAPMRAMENNVQGNDQDQLPNRLLHPSEHTSLLLPTTPTQ